MSDHSIDASLQEKCFPSLSTDPEMDEAANQNESEATSLPEPKKNAAITYLNSSAKFTDDSYSCDKSLDQINSHKVTISSDSVNRELAETDICSDLFTAQSDTLNGEVTKSSMQDRTNGLVHSVHDKGSYPFQFSCSKSLTNESKQDLVAKSNHIVNFEQIPTNNVPIEINTLENSALSNENMNLGNDLKSTGDEVSEKDQNEGCDLDDNYTNCTDDTENSSSEQDPYDTALDEIYHVPKTPIFNGNLHSERRSNLKRKAEDVGNEENSKRKRTIQFEGVTVFYFPRSQGFTCVPSQGGSTLGMSRRHFSIKSFSLAEHSAEQRKSHRDYLLRLRRQRNNQEIKDIGSQCSSSEESEENSEEASDVSDSELEADSFFFLQPLPIRQRRALLRQSGIRQIEGLEKDECKDIRISREMCGCQCKVYCDPNSCQCSQAGIKCQVDRHSFPCGCSRDGCSNPNGRIEFNPIRVRTHFLHTLMRLEIEKCQNQHQWELQQQQQRGDSSLDLTKVTVTSSWLQPSNGASTTTFGSANGNAIGNTLPFFASQDPSLQINPATELHPGNVSGSGIYPPFELRQVDSSGSSNGVSLFPSGSAPTTTATPYQESKNEPHINPVTNSQPDFAKGNEHEPLRGFIYPAAASTRSALGLDYLSPGQSRLPQDTLERECNGKGHLNPALLKITAIPDDASRDISGNCSSAQDHQGSGLPEKIVEQTLSALTEAREKSCQRSACRNESVNAAPSVWLGEMNVEGTVGFVEQKLVKGDRSKEFPQIEASDDCSVQNPCASKHATECVSSDERSSRFAHPTERTRSDNKLNSLLKATTGNEPLGESPRQSDKLAYSEGSAKPAAPTQVASEAAERVTQSTNVTSLSSDDSNQNETVSSRLTPTSGSEVPLGTPLPAKSAPEPTSPRDNIKEQKNINILEGVPA